MGVFEWDRSMNMCNRTMGRLLGTIFFLCMTECWASDSTLGRFAFWVPPERMAEFEVAYQEKLVPILNRHGLMASSGQGRATPDSVFTRLFEFDTPSQVFDAQEMLEQDPAWRETLGSLGETFGTSGQFSVPEEGGRFFHYTSPSGPGQQVAAGSGQRHWSNYGVPDGLAENAVMSIAQDREGSLWFGTWGGGVSRYDGKKFTTFTTQDGLAGNWGMSIFQDREGFLWFGTRYGGVSRYDGKKFTTFSTQDGLAGDLVSSIFQDREGLLWFGTSGGVSRYDGETFATFTTRDGLAHNFVRSIFQNQEGVLWFSTSGGVSRYDGETFDTFTAQDGLAHYNVLSIFQDREGLLWFGTHGGGVSRYDGETFTTFTTQDGLAHNGVNSIVQGRDGSLWFGTEDGGVSRYDRETFITLTTQDGLADNRVRSIVQDREGSLWFGTAGGVSRYDGETFTTFTTQDGLAPNRVNSIVQDRDGSLWFGTVGGGVSRYDGETFTAFTTQDGLVNNNVWSVFQDREELLWFGTVGGGVSQYDGETFTTFTTQDGLADNMLWSIVQDREGVFWFGTSGGGVSRYDGETFTAFTTQDGLADNRVRSIVQDREGLLWFGTHGGVSRYDGETFTTFTTQDGLAHNRVNSIVQDREGLLWIGTDGGVNRYDGETFTTFTPQDGLAHNRVWSVVQDREGLLWFGTSGGVSRYDGETFTTFTTKEGLTHNAVWSIFQDREGSLWFGTGSGVTRYRPPAPAPPPVFIDAVLADRRYEGLADIAIPSSVALTTFEFHGVSFKTRPDAMVYRYRLLGYEDAWRTTRAQRVEYTDLPFGRYTFVVQAVDRDLAYSETPATVSLTVQFPYERLGWALALGIACVLIAWQTIRVLRRDRRLQTANMELGEAVVQAQAASQAKSRFLAHMSHELRTPLNGILGYAQILNRDKGLTRKHLDGVGVIRQSGQHLLGLINDILDLARIEAGKVELEKSEISLTGFHKNVVSIIEVRAKEKGLKFSSAVDTDVSLVVLGDEQRLRQVLLNLLGNAVKFTDEGEVGLRVEARAQVGKGAGEQKQWLRFEVTDTGVGLSEEEMARIFKPFEQIGVAGSQAEGTGLGLAISQQYVELMGGQIQVESTPGEGSRFWFEVVLPEVAGQMETVSVAMPVGFEGETKQVLIVDDKEANRSVLANLLEPLGFETSQAENGQVALDRAQASRPDLILMDLVMPELDGFEAVRRLRQDIELKDVVVIALSASVLEGDQQQSLDAGCDDFVAKPVDAGLLYKKMGEHLELGWVYETAEPQGVAEQKDVSIVVPPTELLQPLFNSARRGEILAVQAEIDRIEALDKTYGAFISQIRELAAGFQMDEICAFLKPYLEDQA